MKCKLRQRLPLRGDFELVPHLRLPSLPDGLDLLLITEGHTLENSSGLFCVTSVTWP